MSSVSFPGSGTAIPSAIVATRSSVIGWPSSIDRPKAAAPAACTPMMRAAEPPPRSALAIPASSPPRSEEHTSELQSRGQLVCRLLLEKKNKRTTQAQDDHAKPKVDHDRIRVDGSVVRDDTSRLRDHTLSCVKHAPHTYQGTGDDEDAR